MKGCKTGVEIAALHEFDPVPHNLAPTSQFTSQPLIRRDSLNRCGTRMVAAIVVRYSLGRRSPTSVPPGLTRIAFEHRRRATYREFESLLLRQHLRDRFAAGRPRYAAKHAAECSGLLLGRNPQCLPARHPPRGLHVARTEASPETSLPTLSWCSPIRVDPGSPS